ncbi:IS110 family transposase [Candidatus Kuenenbacteria bacterium CG_4_9_14_3_um_filter_39_14]|uniref:IS110 family transposase n=1 Tax=Candidatus Kuenenbacteria bacterium CG_4_9_14_3_um_filter_39_14 TaxID=1974616 RepID=A0A2M7Z8M1_9BACT|nr:MAG: IS110 family transposase [Candidatus Kuenenbacteria bacterium CG_4_9_14_3_um_filter_39_14]
MLYYLGIDVGKFSHSLCLLTEAGKKTIFQINNNREGFEKLRIKLSELNCDKNILVGMEATGHYFLNLYDWLLQCGFDSEQIALLNPLQVKSFRNTNLRGAKSDNVDSERIAVLLKFGEFKRCNVATDEMMNLRELTRLRADLVANIGDLKRKIISVMDRVFPEFMTVFSNRFGKTVMSLLNSYTPEEMAELSLEKLTDVIKNLSGRGRGISQKKIQALHEASRNSIGITFGRQAFKIELDILLTRLKVFKEQVEKLENEIQLIAEKFDSKIFTIPGIGATTGAAILSEIGNIQNFSLAVKLIAFAGLDPKLKESGKYQGRTPISKRGSKYLRNAIWYSAMVACRVDDKFKKFYQDRRNKGKSHRYSVTAAANKLTKVIYHVLKNKCEYDSKLV